MTLTDLPLLTALRAKMRWHATRQKLLAQNVANADTAGFVPHDLKAFDVKAVQAAPTGPALTNVAHLPGVPDDHASGAERAQDFEVAPSGNAVNLEEEMMKVAANQIDYQTAVGLYERGLSLIRSAVGKHS